MGINIIEQNNDESLIEYKLPDFIKESNNVGDTADDFEILQVLGQGGFSKVLKVKSKKNFGIYAMKKINATQILKKYKQEKYYMNEVLLLKKLDHQNVIKCFNIFEVFENGEKYLYFIMEFMNNGDLQSYNVGNIKFGVRTPEEKLWKIFFKCLNGLSYIHRKGIIHRDIKAANLFLDDNFNIKIADFNISAVADENFAKIFVENLDQIDDLKNHFTRLGTQGYMSPEIVKRRKYDQKVDIYAMGMMFFELCYQCRPDKNKRPSNGFKASQEMHDFIVKMIDDDQNNRPTCDEALLEAKKYFIKYYLKNSSIESAINCLNNFKNVKDYFRNDKNADFICNKKNELSQLCLDISLVLDNDDNIQNNKQLKENLYNLREILIKDGLDIKNDNVEIDPGKFIIFFIKKLNSELNEIFGNLIENDNEQKKRFKILSRNYHFSQGTEKFNFNLRINNYNKKISSFISRNFFSYIITTRTCLKCGITRRNFSKLYFIPINISILQQKMGYNNLSLMNGFDCLNKTCVSINKRQELACTICNGISEFKETKDFYRTAKNLIIIFDRGENFENKKFVDFEEYLYLNNSGAENNNKVNYQLIGIISKKDEVYISFIKKNNIWISSNGDKINFNEVKKYGVIIALFYYSDDNNLIIENKDKIDLSTVKLEKQIFIDKYHFTYYFQSPLNNNKNNSNEQSTLNNINNQQTGFLNMNNINTEINNQQMKESQYTDNQMGGIFGNIQPNIYNNNINNYANNNIQNNNNINLNNNGQSNIGFNIPNMFLQQNPNFGNNIFNNNQGNDFMKEGPVECL